MNAKVEQVLGMIALNIQKVQIKLDQIILVVFLHCSKCAAPSATLRFNSLPHSDLSYLCGN